MNLTEDREKNSLYEWATRVEKKGFRDCDNPNSAFEQFDNSGNIVEFGFSDISEFEDMLKHYVGNRVPAEVIRYCAVAAFKRRPSNEVTNDRKQNEIDIPDFVYAF